MRASRTVHESTQNAGVCWGLNESTSCREHIAVRRGLKDGRDGRTRGGAHRLPDAARPGPRARLRGARRLRLPRCKRQGRCRDCDVPEHGNVLDTLNGRVSSTGSTWCPICLTSTLTLATATGPTR